jgi:hypothetical protein
MLVRLVKNKIQNKRSKKLLGGKKPVFEYSRPQSDKVATAANIMYHHLINQPLPARGRSLPPPRVLTDAEINARLQRSTMCRQEIEFLEHQHSRLVQNHARQQKSVQTTQNSMNKLQSKLRALRMERDTLSAPLPWTGTDWSVLTEDLRTISPDNSVIFNLPTDALPQSDLEPEVKIEVKTELLEFEHDIPVDLNIETSINVQPPATRNSPDPMWTNRATGSLLTVMKATKQPRVLSDLRHQRGILKTMNKYASSKTLPPNN